MKKQLIYTVFIVLLFAGMYWLNKDVSLTTYQWEPTFETNDRQPFGAYAFDKILSDSWKSHYLHNYYSFYDIADLSSEEEDALPETEFDLSQDTDEETSEEAFVPEETISSPKIAYADYNVLIMTNYLRLDSIETEILLKYVEKGGSVILATNSIPAILSDTLNISITYRLNWNRLDLSTEQPMEKIRLCAPDSGQTVFTFPQPLTKNYFKTSDTLKSAHSYFDSLFILSETLDKKPTGLRYQIGEGNLILFSNPLLFTNYGILNDSIQPYILRCLAYLNNKPLIRTEYYQVGSQGGKSQSELRVILSEKPLKGALYTTLIAILIFMIFTARRKQKVIPVIKPPVNKMRAFVRSIAGLYLQKNGNADIILKKQIYWGEKLKRKYGIDIVNERHDYDFYKQVAAKTRQPFDEIRRLFLDLGAIDETTTSVSDEEMMQLLTKMNEIE